MNLGKKFYAFLLAFTILVSCFFVGNLSSFAIAEGAQSSVLDESGGANVSAKAVVDFQNFLNIYNGVQNKKDVIIAVLDTGFDSSDSIFSGRIVGGYDIADKKASVVSDNYHGTHTAGIIAQFAPSDNIKIMPIKVFYGDDAQNCRAQDVADGIYYAVDHGASVINMSLGCEGQWDSAQEAINYAYAHGVVCVAAAGNAGVDASTYSPAGLDNVIAVGAIDTTKTGNNPVLWNDNMKSNYGNKVAIWAPGKSINSTVNDSDGAAVWAAASGTSCSAPIVSGLIASMMSCGAADSSDVESILENSAKTVNTGDSNIGSIKVLDMAAAMSDDTSTKQLQVASSNSIDLAPEAPIATAMPVATVMPQVIDVKAAGENDSSVASVPKLNENYSGAYMQSYDDGNFHPDNDMTRAEAAVMFARLLVNNEAVPYKGMFSDVPAGAWYAQAVELLATDGIIMGDNGVFNPDAPITRAEFAAIIARFENLNSTNSAMFSDVPIGSWYFESVNFVASQGWVKGYDDSTFRPDDNISRAEVVTIMNRILGRQFNGNQANLKQFSDVPTNYWAYGDIEVATNRI